MDIDWSASIDKDEHSEHTFNQDFVDSSDSEELSHEELTKLQRQITMGLVPYVSLKIPKQEPTKKQVREMLYLCEI
jgi:hypothetical protein